MKPFVKKKAIIKPEALRYALKKQHAASPATHVDVGVDEDVSVDEDEDGPLRAAARAAIGAAARQSYDGPKCSGSVVPDDDEYPSLSIVGGDDWQVVVGREAGCALCLGAQLHGKAKKISRRHCGMWMSADGTAYVCNYSANGTWINGSRMQAGGQAAPLDDGDKISFPSPPGVTVPTLTFKRKHPPT